MQTNCVQTKCASPKATIVSPVTGLDPLLFVGTGTGVGDAGGPLLELGVGVTGARIIGAGVTGVGVTGAGVTGAGVTGWQTPHVSGHNPRNQPGGAPGGSVVQKL